MVILENMKTIPTFSEFVNEGVLSNYRTEKENMKLVYQQMQGSFENLVKKLIEEKIPFYFDCKYKEHMRIGYLMNNIINNVQFGGYILNNKKSTEEICEEFDKILQETTVDKSSKLHVGRTNFSDLTKSSDLEDICVVTKALKQYSKERGQKFVTGNKFEVTIKMESLCDSTRINDLIDYVF